MLSWCQRCSAERITNSSLSLIASLYWVLLLQINTLLKYSETHSQLFTCGELHAESMLVLWLWLDKTVWIRVFLCTLTSADRSAGPPGWSVLGDQCWVCLVSLWLFNRGLGPALTTPLHPSVLAATLLAPSGSSKVLWFFSKVLFIMFSVVIQLMGLPHFSNTCERTHDKPSTFRRRGG